VVLRAKGQQQLTKNFKVSEKDNKKKIRTIVVLGSGNVATHLSLAFHQAGLKILQVYSRSMEHAKELANKVDSNYTSGLANITDNADIYLFSVSDSAIQPILDKINWTGKILVHTAGSVAIEIFKSYSENFGVIYPLQSFSKNRKIDISKVPFFIEANSPEIADTLEILVRQISNNIYRISFEERKILHLAAVFASNFSNHMYAIADELLKKNNIPFNYLQPLVYETSAKAFELGPKVAQTGPAIRNNFDILKKHAVLLNSEPDWQNLYKFISDNIIKYHKQ
jgi:predicted short-subunit dehydrogenase-like oxidoreductase (DUF2520 family)